MGTTALSVGASYVNGTEFAMWMLKDFVELVCSFESGFVCAFAYVLEHRGLIIKDFDSIVIIHDLN